MKRKRFLVLLSSVCLIAPCVAQADDLFSRETSTGMRAGAIFGDLPALNIDDKLIGATSPICDHIEIHKMTETDDGIFKMRKIDDLDVKAGTPTKLEPTGYHLMLIGLKEPLKAGASFPLTLTFRTSATQTITIPVKSHGE